jgi:HEAT repeat protein
MSRRLLLLLSLVVLVPALPAAPPTAEKINPDDEKLLKAAKIAADGPVLLDYFRKRTLTAKDREQIDRLIRLLGNDSFKVREKASEDLLALGSSALPQLRQALEDLDEEIRERAREGIAAAEGKINPVLSAAVVRVLRLRAPAESVKVLLDYLPNAENDAVAEEVFMTLAVLGVKENKVDPLFVEALKDKQRKRRAAAALVMGRSGTAEQRRTVQALLKDEDVRVRFRAAQGLIAARDRAAVPAFIGLLTDAPPDLAMRAEEMLSCVAAGRGPRLPITDNVSQNRNVRTAWEQWWKQNAKVDLNRADVDLPQFNPTLRAREAARQFAAAILPADKEKLDKLTEIPFHVLGTQTFTKREQVAEYFATMMQQNIGRGIPFTIPLVSGTTTVEEYTKTAQPVVQQSLAKLPRNNLRVVLMQSPQWNGDCALFVRVIGDQPQVVAVSFGPAGVLFDGVQMGPGGALFK